MKTFMTQPANDKWMTTGEAAQFLRTTTGAIRTLVYRRRLPVHRHPGGRRLLFKRADLDRLIETTRKGV